MKGKIDIDWDDVMGNNGGEEEPPELEFVSKDKPAPKPLLVIGGCGLDCIAVDDQKDCVQSLTDREISERIERQWSHLVSLGPKLPDKGAKIRAKIKQLDAEKNRRMLWRPQMDAGECEKLTQSTSSGSLDVPKQGNTASKDVSRSTFAAYFSKNQETDCQSVKPFEKELQILECESRKLKSNGEVSQRRRQRGWSPSRQDQFQRAGEHSPSGCRDTLSNGDHKSNVTSLYSLRDDDSEFISYDTPRKPSLQESPPENSRFQKKQRQTIINVDEEEPQPVTMTELVAELPEGMKEDIYYPSRDDPEFVQVCRKDIACLSPAGYLTSPIMNFYIRYLQQQASPTNRAVSDCHFFNTYFYKKLKEAVSYKGNDKDAFFVKFRRWWKGIDLFRKAYIFIPIHEEVHWSLVIICIPDKEDDTGLIILHLDSLGFHYRKSIFENVKRFLKEEWSYLNQDATRSDVPISDKIWRNFPRRIYEEEIEVPQQKNDYDCGLFVLFFMERFTVEAPERLKKKDLAMFDKKWFRPEQASALRVKIRKILIKLFQNSSGES